MCCHSLLQGIFLTQGSPTLQADSLPSEPPSVSANHEELSVPRAPPEEGWFQAAGVRRRLSGSREHTPLVPLALGNAALRAPSEKGPNVAMTSWKTTLESHERYLACNPDSIGCGVGLHQEVVAAHCLNFSFLEVGGHNFPTSRK